MAQLFRANLEARGLRIFLDVKADYWGPFPSELKERVGDTPYFIVLLTTGCFDSPWMKVEIAEALKTQRKILVIRDSSFTMPPAETLDPVLQALSMLNHITYVHDFSDEVVRRVALLVGDVGTIRTRSGFWWRATLVAALCAAAGFSIAFAWSARTDKRPEVSTHAESTPVSHPATPPRVEPVLPAPVITPPTPPPDEEPAKMPVSTRPAQDQAPASTTRSAAIKPTVRPPAIDAARSSPSVPNTVDPCVINYWFDEHGDKHYKPECYLKPSGDKR